MRKISPLLIVLAALCVYAARGAWVDPLLHGDEAAAPSRPAVMEASLTHAGDEPDLAAVEEPATPANAGIEPKHGRINRNSSLYVEMRKMGVSPVDIEHAVRASKRTYNLKRVRPGQRFEVYQAADGALDSLSFHVSPEEILKIRRLESGYTAAIDTVPYDVTYHVTQGTIHSSVFASLQEQGASTELATSLAEIFGWTIDFINDIRAGDSFAVLYEQRTYPDGRTRLGDVLAARVVARGDDHYALRFRPAGVNSGYYDVFGKSLEKSLLRVPLKYTRVTSNFTGRRFHPTRKRYMPHWGVDYGAPTGTPVHATGDGVVQAATWRSFNGKYVKIRHNRTYTTYYLHLSRFAKGIRAGKKVRQGQVIGYVGMTGAATAPHLDYRIKKNGRWVNPRRLKLPSKNPVPKTDLARFERARDACLLRLNDGLLTGEENQTVLVDRPTPPIPNQIATPF